MINAVRLPVIAVSVLSLLSCADPPAPNPEKTTRPERPHPAVTVTVTASPTAPITTPTPKASDTIYRVRAEFFGTSDVTFDVSLNGQNVGSFNADATNDITPIVNPGRNQLEVHWKGQHEADERSRAQLFLESQRPGQDRWNSLFSREVARKTKESTATASFDVGPPTVPSAASSTPKP